MWRAALECLYELHTESSDLQLAKAHVESIRIPGAQFTFKPLSWAAPPYSMEKNTLANRAAAKVLEEMLGSPPIYYRWGLDSWIPVTAYPDYLYHLWLHVVRLEPSHLLFDVGVDAQLPAFRNR